ncbi:MAG: CBS domain-containing protein [Bacillota bacterium]
MPSPRSVADLMRPVETCPAVSTDDTLETAVAVLRAAGARGEPAVLVLTPDRRPAGILTLDGILHAFEPDFVETTGWRLPVVWSGFFGDKCREGARRRVADVMRALDSVPAVDPGDPLPKAVHLMRATGLPLLPVARGERIIGMLRINDMLAAIEQAIS